jgi:hypothetical protein
VTINDKKQKGAGKIRCIDCTAIGYKERWKEMRLLSNVRGGSMVLIVAAAGAEFHNGPLNARNWMERIESINAFAGAELLECNDDEQGGSQMVEEEKCSSMEGG